MDLGDGMNKKMLMIIGAVLVIVIIAILAYYSSKNQGAGNLSASPTPVAITDWGNDLVFDTQEQKFKSFDPDTNSYRDINVRIEETPTYAELSGNQKSLFYTTDPNAKSDTIEVNPDLSNLKALNVADNSLIFELKNIFAPKFLTDDTIIYQDFASGNTSGFITVRSLENGKIIKQVNIGEEDPVEINVLDRGHIIATQYSSDVGEVSSKLINIDTRGVNEYISGRGLSFKTVYNSPLVASQVIENEKTSTSLLKWSSKENILNLNISVGQLTWNQDGGKSYYIKDGQIIERNLSSGSERTLKNISASASSSIETLSNGQLILKNEGETTILDPNI